MKIKKQKLKNVAAVLLSTLALISACTLLYLNQPSSDTLLFIVFSLALSIIMVYTGIIISFFLE